VPPFRVRVLQVPVLALALAALLVGAASACKGGDEDEGSFKPGKYEYNLTEVEKDALRAMLPADYASQLDDVDELKARLEFSEDGWVQTWMLDGTSLTHELDDENLFQRDHYGTFELEGDRLALSVNDEFDGTLTYEWSLDANALTLKLHENSANPAASRELVFATQHTFARLNE
jgi:hypothetical protein